MGDFACAPYSAQRIEQRYRKPPSCLNVHSGVQLGIQGSGDLMIQKGHELGTTGLYSRIRHPMYFGALIELVGFGFVFRSIIAMLRALAIYFAVLQQRWMREEELLEAQFGEQYVECKRRT